jgi:hypothetical protein
MRLLHVTSDRAADRKQEIGCKKCAKQDHVVHVDIADHLGDKVYAAEIQRLLVA